VQKIANCLSRAHKSLQSGADAWRLEQSPPEGMSETAAKVLLVTFRQYVIESKRFGLLQDFLIKAENTVSEIALAV
jgi:hypothetical protein